MSHNFKRHNARLHQDTVLCKLHSTHFRVSDVTDNDEGSDFISQDENTQS